jgi:hypothetical protein
MSSSAFVEVTMENITKEDLEVLHCLSELKYMSFPEESDEKLFIVKSIKEHRYINGYLLFLTFWEGYSDKESTYEPRESFKIEGTRKYNEIFTSYCRKNGITL